LDQTLLWRIVWMNWSDKQTNSTPGEDCFDLVALVSSHLVKGELA